jgi:hypothetical protein
MGTKTVECCFEKGYVACTHNCVLVLNTDFQDSIEYSTLLSNSAVSGNLIGCRISDWKVKVLGI